jgi:Cellulase (glycosyl hydrolase family 5)
VLADSAAASFGTELSRPTDRDFPGLWTENGVVYKGGQPYRGVGCNYFDLFLRILHDPTDETSLACLQKLSDEGIPFVRFAVAFDNSDWKRFITNQTEFLKCFDLVVRTAERAKIGLIPSFFWGFKSFPDLVNEPCNQWGKPDSKTCVLMRKIVSVMLERYKTSPSLWAWEFGNEPNLAADLPNATEFRKKGGTVHDDLSANTMVMMLAEFAKEVRRHDPHRLIISGNSAPRPSAWHNTAEKSWNSDTKVQTLEILRRDNPEPLDTICIHFYADHPATWAKGDADYLNAVHALAREMKRPVFIGEFGVASNGNNDETRKKFEKFLAVMESADVNLAAFWVFDFNAQSPKWNVTFANKRAYMLKLAAEANRRWNDSLTY